MSRPVRAVWRFACALPPARQDAVLYLASAVFAAIVAVTQAGDYENWAVIAVGPYALAAIVAEALARRHPGEWTTRRVRQGLVIFVLAGAVLAPLGALVVLRAEGGGLWHAQPEVRVIEAAGDRLLAGHDLYLPDPATVGVSPVSDSRRVDSDSYFPYLPGMVVPGMLNDIPGPPELGDARLALTGTTLVLAAVALLVCDAPRGRRGRALQVLVVLPTGAMPLATGGDDLPVLALMLLALVLAERRRPVLSGIASGVSGTLKLTAWPLIVVLAAAQRDRRGRRSVLPYAAAVGVVAVPVTLAGFLAGPAAFVTNVIEFPLGIAKVKSPAASPLLGEALTSLFPKMQHEITAGLLGLGALAVIVLAWLWPPTTPMSAARLTGLALLIATVIAPATRFGYLIYPVNLLTWAYMLAPVTSEDQDEEGPDGRGGQDQSASSTWTRSSSKRLVGAV